MNRNKPNNIPYQSITIKNIMSDTERKQNKVTKTAGLTFNVNAVKSKLKDYHDMRGVPNPMYGGGQIAMATVLEKFCELVFTECATQTQKNISGLKLVNVNDLQRLVLLRPELRNYFVIPMSQYNANQIYKDLLPIDSSEMDLVMARVDKDLSLTAKAKNLAYFLVCRVFQDLISTSNHLMAYAKKHTFSATCVSYAVRQCFAEALAKELCDDIARVMKAFDEDIDVMDAEVPSKSTSGTMKASDDADTGEEKTDKSDKSGKEEKKKTDSKKDSDKKESSDKSAKETAGKKPAAKNAAKNKSENSSKAEKIEVDDDSDSSSSSDDESDDDKKNSKEKKSSPKAQTEKPKAPAGKPTTSNSSSSTKPAGKAKTSK